MPLRLNVNSGKIESHLSYEQSLESIAKTLKEISKSLNTIASAQGSSEENSEE